jgi:hypothetical protein
MPANARFSLRKKKAVFDQPLLTPKPRQLLFFHGKTIAPLMRSTIKRAADQQRRCVD